MRVLFFFFVCVFLHSCTYSVVVNGSAGSGTDAVTETDTVDPVVSPTVDIPGGL